MKILITEQQRLLLESDGDNWGCNLFEENSEERDWCTCTMGRIKSKYKIIQDQINGLANFLKSQSDLYDRIKFYSENDPFFSDNIANLNELETLLSDCKKTSKTIQKFKSDIAEKFLFVDKKETKHH